MKANRSLTLWGLAALALSVSLAAGAEEYATVRVIKGGGYLQGAQDDQPQSLTINTPLMEGDSLWTDTSGRVDLLLQDGNHVWLDNSTRIEIDQLPVADAQNPRALRLRVWKGALLLDLRGWSPDMTSYVVASPSASVSPTRAGLYLVEVENVDRTKVAALGGGCLVASAGETVALDDREMTYAEYGYPPLTPLTSGVEAAGLLRFRDEHLPRRVSGGSDQYLPPDLSAYASDLDANGSWSYSGTYGYVWTPNYVSAEWSPYTDGRWIYNSWGMTWVPYEPWGWAPCHYGRWVFGAGIGWSWCPMPYFAPAWCSFWWGDDGWLGWCPLGYYGAPLWNPCGWYSCPIGNIYNPYLNPSIVHHRTAPPPNPIYPVAHGSPGDLQGGGLRGGGHPSTINLPPSRVADLRSGRIGMKAVGAALRDPIASPRRSFPAVQPQPGGRGGRTEPLPADGASGGIDRPGLRRWDPSTGSGRTGSGTPTGRTEPANPRVDPQPRRTPSPSFDLPPARRQPSAIVEPRVPRVEPRENPGWNDRTAPVQPRRVEPSYGETPRPGRVEPPQRYQPPTVRETPRSEPRYIPSRPPSGVGQGGGRQAQPRYTPTPAPTPAPAPHATPKKR